MKTWVKVLLIVGISLILAGGLIFTVLLAINGWDIKKLSNDHFEDKEYALTEDFKSISIHAYTADVVLLPSDDREYRVVVHERTTEKHSVEVKDDTLWIQAKDSRNWYDYLTWLSFDTPKITLYLPRKEFTALTIEGGTGSVTMNQLSAQKIHFSVGTGSLKLTDVSAAGTVYAETGTGEIRMSHCTAGELSAKTGTGFVGLEDTLSKEKLSVETGTGDVNLKGCDGGELSIETGTGSISGTLLSDKVFITETGTGSISVPKTSTGGRCELTTGTGSIRIEIVKE